MRPAGDAVVARCGIAVARIGSPLTVTARAGIDQPRVESFDRIVVQTESLHHAFLVVLDEYVGAGNELAGQLDSFLRLYVKHDAFLVDVNPQVLVGIRGSAGLHPYPA